MHLKYINLNMVIAFLNTNHHVIYHSYFSVILPSLFARFCFYVLCFILHNMYSSSTHTFDD